MKGLLLKDWYMMKKYCKAYLFIAIVFIAVSFAGDSNLFFVFYPSLLCGMIPVNLLAYDERSKWLQYSETMPYTKAQIVSGKYLIGLGTQLTMLIVTGIAQAIRMSISETFKFNEYIVIMTLLFILASTTSSISLPFMFKWGVEKGRIAYYAMIGIVCAASVISSSLILIFEDMQKEIKMNAILIVFSIIGIGIYALSWYLSIIFYQKREIQ